MTAPDDVAARINACLQAWSHTAWGELHSSPTVAIRAVLPDWDLVVDGHRADPVCAYVLRHGERWLLLGHPVDHDPMASLTKVQGWWDKQGWRTRRDLVARSMVLSREWGSLVDVAMHAATTDPAYEWSSGARAQRAVVRALKHTPDQRAALETLIALSPHVGVERMLKQEG